MEAICDNSSSKHSIEKSCKTNCSYKYYSDEFIKKKKKKILTRQAYFNFICFEN